jgi:hypothetical protein
MIVHVGHLVVLAPLLILAAVLVRVHQAVVIVLVRVIVRLVVERAHHLAAAVVVGDVVVVVGVDYSGMLVLVLRIALNSLRDLVALLPNLALHLSTSCM